MDWGEQIFELKLDFISEIGLIFLLFLLFALLKNGTCE